MRIFNKFRGTKGFISIWQRVIRFRYMITEQAKQRTKILAFWEEYGTEATEKAFGTKRRTLFYWQSKLKLGLGKLDALNPIKRIPKNKRKRTWDVRILDELKRIREQRRNLGKDKIYPLLKKYATKLGLICPSIPTIGRLIKDLGGLRISPQKVTGMGKIVKVNRHKVLRKPKGFRAMYPGHCIALDTIEKQRNGVRVYILVAEDVYSRIGFACASISHSSKTMTHFLYLVSELFPYPIKHVLTDNGSEFKKYFNQLCGKKNFTHFHTYPRTPKMNAHCERLNRTLQEEFIDYHINLLFDDITKFNTLFQEYLEFYNTERVHFAFHNKLTPLGAMVQSNHYQANLPEECKDGWAHTLTGLFLFF
jgi:transposase InsO family protein